MLNRNCLWLIGYTGLKSGDKKWARGWLKMVSEVTVMDEINKGERIVREEMAAQERARKFTIVSEMSKRYSYKWQ